MSRLEKLVRDNEDSMTSDFREELLYGIKEIEDLLELHRTEIFKLTDARARRKDGYENASAAGLDVLAERARHRRLEGYDDAHDDVHNDFSLTGMAIAYASHAVLMGTTGKGFQSPPDSWPHSAEEWKPKNTRRSLVVAASVIVAEIERLDRLEVSSSLHGAGD